MLKIHDAQGEGDHDSDFDTQNEGFEKDWADDLVVSDPGYLFVEDGREVARARVDPERRHLDHYQGLESVAPLAEIALIEVHRDHQNRGIGREAISLLLARYPGHSFVAFAGKDAEGFWRSIGWKIYSKDEPTESPLFAWLVAD